MRVLVITERNDRIDPVVVALRQAGMDSVQEMEGALGLLRRVASFQPDIILIPEVPLDMDQLEQRVSELYDLQKHVVIVVGEGMRDASGRQLGATTKSYDPAGNVIYSGAAEELKRLLAARFGDDFFGLRRKHESADSVIFTRKARHIHTDYLVAHQPVQ